MAFIKIFIEQALKKKGALLPCARCAGKLFTVADGYFAVPQQEKPTEINFGGGQVLPCAVVICSNCGHLSFHALGALGLSMETGLPIPVPVKMPSPAQVPPPSDPPPATLTPPLSDIILASTKETSAQ